MDEEQSSRELRGQIAERRQAEEALRQSRADLAHELAGTQKLQKLSGLLIEDESGAGLHGQILEAAMSIMRADFGSIQILEPERGELRLLAFKNLHPESAASWQKVAIGAGTSCGAALQHGGRIFLPDIEEAEIFRQHPEALEPYRKSGIAAAQSTPLTGRDGRLIGMISTHWRQRHEANDQELALFDVLARQTSDLLECRQALDTQRSSAIWQASQNDAFQAILDGATLEDALAILIRSAVAHLGEVGRCAIHVADRSGADASPAAPDPLAGGWSFPIETFSGKVVGTLVFDFETLRAAAPQDLEFIAVLTRAAAIIISRSQESDDRTGAEQALRRSEEKYRTLFDSIDEGLAIVELIRDAAGEVVDVLFVDVNAVFERLTGLVGVRGKLRSQTGAQEAAWLDALGQVARTGEPHRTERYNRDLGRWYRIFVSRVGEHGSNQVAVVFEDISDRKHRERNQALLAEITDELVGLETIPETMERLGQKIARHFDLSWCMFVELSPDLESTVTGWGWNAPEVASLQGPYRMRDFLAAEQLERHLLGEAVIVSDVQNDDRVSAQSFGALGIRSLMIIPLVRDRICRFQLAIIDTKVRFWRADEIELIRELTQRVWTRLERARTEEALRHSEAQLRKVAAELQEADRGKNHFLAILGHELRNPLAAIRNGVSLLRSEKARPESRAAALPIVADQVSHMERLVDDLLDLTRVVQGSVRVRREPMALQEALRQALEMVRPQAEAGGFTIDVEFPPEPLEILGDRVRLTQVFMNVLGNAVKYSGDSRQIEVRVEREAEMAVVRIRDHGLGMSAELLPRIFEPFVQAAPGLTLQAGLGLGLAVVRQLVRLHDGEIETFSDGEGKGSEFVLRLPLAPPAP